MKHFAILLLLGLSSLHATTALSQQAHTTFSITFESNEDLVDLFHSAAAKASCSTLASFLRSGIHIDEPGHLGETALHHAAQKPSPGSVYYLLKQGANIEAIDNLGNTPLMYAALMGRLTCTKALIKSGANVFHRNRSGKSALEIAVQKGFLKTVNTLIDTGADLGPGPYSEGFTALHKAAIMEFVDIAKSLIKAGSPVDAITREGKTPLHYAAHSGNPEMITLLLDANADATLKDANNQTPRAIAERSIPDHDDCILCSLGDLKIRHREEAILRLRVAELPEDSKNDLENHLKLKKDEL